MTVDNDQGNKGWSDTAYVASGNQLVDVESGAIITPNECKEVTVQGVYGEQDGKDVVLAQDENGREVSTFERWIVYKLD